MQSIFKNPLTFFTYYDLHIRFTDFDDVVWSNAGNDFIFTYDGDDIIDGGAGNDIIAGGDGADMINGGDGVDTADYSSSALAVNIDLQNNTFSGGEAEGDILTTVENIIGSNVSGERDYIYGDDNDNKIEGLDGDDILQGGGGEDIIDGGDGWDWVKYTRSDEGINVNLATNVNTGGDAEGDQIFNTEAIEGSAHDDVIVGQDGKDYIRAGDGDDYLDGGLGIDQLHGGKGDDTYYYASGRDTAHEKAGEGVDRVVFDAAWSPEDVSISINPTTGAAVFTFVAGVHELIFNYLPHFEVFSFDGHPDMNINDLLAIANGSDNEGTAGDDVFIGDADSESYDGLGGNDTLDYSASIDAVRVDLEAGTGSAGDAAGDSYTSIENVMGSDSSTVRDYIYGDDADNHIEGLAGNDILEGGGGADVIDGGAGWDWLFYTRSDEGVNLNLETGVHTGGDAEGDTIIGIEGIRGSDHNDTMRGGDGNDQLHGQDGNDVLTGGMGRDLLYGGDGADEFVFEAISTYDRVDIIRDFDSSEGDTLNITDLLANYDPLDDMISDFVQLDNSGSNTNVMINESGEAGGDFVTAFSIQGGISDTLSDLINNDILVTDQFAVI